MKPVLLGALLTVLACAPAPASSIAAQRRPAPVQSYKVIATFPHDTSSFTQGLVFASDGQLYESTGLEGESTLRRVDIATGQTLQSIDVPVAVFRRGPRAGRRRAAAADVAAQARIRLRPQDLQAEAHVLLQDRRLGHRLRRHVEPGDERRQRHAVVPRSENARGDEDAARAGRRAGRSAI